MFVLLNNLLVGGGGAVYAKFPILQPENHQTPIGQNRTDPVILK